jgi:hypothetical protein
MSIWTHVEELDAIAVHLHVEQEVGSECKNGQPLSEGGSHRLRARLFIETANLIECLRREPQLALERRSPHCAQKLLIRHGPF